jgi:hypothetical protein
MAKVIGVDPGVKTGVAILVDGKIIELFESNFWDVIDVFELHKDAIIIIELPTNKHVWHNGATSKGAIQRTGVNVGSCIREAELLVKYLHRKERNYIIQKPLGKKDKDQFRALTGWNKQSNQHTRDAAVMAWGYRLMSINNERN